MKPSLLAFSALFTVLSTSAFAAEKTYSAAEVAAKIEKLEEEIRILKRQNEVNAEIAKTKAEKTPSVELSSTKGLSFTSPDKNISVKLQGSIQADGRFFASDRSSSRNKDEFLVRRLRPVLEATVNQNLSFRLTPDFAGSSPRLFDGYVQYSHSDAVEVRAGKFKAPLSLEQLQSDPDTLFGERSILNNLVTSRDIGVQLQGSLFSDQLEYQLGLFNGGPDASNFDSDDDNNKDVAARIFAKPFASSDIFALRGFGVGIGGSHGEHEGSVSKPLLGEYKTAGQQSFFKYRSGSAASDTTYANGTAWRAIPQAYYYYGPLGVLGEYAVSSQEVARGAHNAELQHISWALEASYVLTGEDARFKGSVKPSAIFNPKEGTWGAVEVTARGGVLKLDDKTFPLFADITKAAREAQTLGTGINWYWNENLRLTLNYDHTAFTGGASSGADLDDENVILSRVQYRF